MQKVRNRVGHGEQFYERIWNVIKYITMYEYKDLRFIYLFFRNDCYKVIEYNTSGDVSENVIKGEHFLSMVLCLPTLEMPSSGTFILIRDM